MAGCIDCGSPTPNRRCPDCQQANSNTEEVDEKDWAECPDCGGRSSGRGVTCADCRTSSTASLRDGETRDDSHARRNLQMLVKHDQATQSERKRLAELTEGDDG